MSEVDRAAAEAKAATERAVAEAKAAAVRAAAAAAAAESEAAFAALLAGAAPPADSLSVAEAPSLPAQARALAQALDDELVPPGSSRFWQPRRELQGHLDVAILHISASDIFREQAMQVYGGAPGQVAGGELQLPVLGGGAGFGKSAEELRVEDCFLATADDRARADAERAAAEAAAAAKRAAAKAKAAAERAAAQAAAEAKAAAERAAAEAKAAAERAAAEARTAATARVAALVPRYASFFASATRGLPFAAFLSHAQASSGDEALLLREALYALGARAWLDQDNEPTLEGMRAGVAASSVFLLLLSKGTLARAAVRLEVKAALEANKPIAFVLVPESDAEVGDTAAAASLAVMLEGREEQAEALAKAGADAAATGRVRALSEAQWAALEARLEDLPPVVLRRESERLWAETVPPLAAALGLDAGRRGAAPAAPATSLFRKRSVLAAPAALVPAAPVFDVFAGTSAVSVSKAASPSCDALIVSAAAGTSQAAFLQLALQQRCARRELVLRLLERGGDAEAAVTGASCVLALLTERFFEEVPVAAALHAALGLKKPLALVWEGDYRHGGLERFDFFINGREEVRDASGGVRVAAVAATPDDLLPLYEGAIAQPFERCAKKRALMLEALLAKLGAVRADALGGRLPPPPLPSGFNEAPVREAVDEIERLLLGGQRGEAVGSSEAGVGVGGAGAYGDGRGAAAAPAGGTTLLPCRVVATGGLGGAGKTTLATAVVRARPAVRAAFDDVFWVTLGKASRSQLLGRMRELISELAEGAVGEAAATTVEAATKRLRELFGKRRALVVVDDAWTQDHFAAFLGAVEAAPTSAAPAGSGSNAGAAVAAALPLP